MRGRLSRKIVRRRTTLASRVSKTLVSAVLAPIDPRASARRLNFNADGTLNSGMIAANWDGDRKLYRPGGGRMSLPAVSNLRNFPHYQKLYSEYRIKSVHLLFRLDPDELYGIDHDTADNPDLVTMARLSEVREKFSRWLTKTAKLAYVPIAPSYTGVPEDLLDPTTGSLFSTNKQPSNNARLVSLSTTSDHDLMYTKTCTKLGVIRTSYSDGSTPTTTHYTPIRCPWLPTFPLTDGTVSPADVAYAAPLAPEFGMVYEPTNEFDVSGAVVGDYKARFTLNASVLYEVEFRGPR